MLRCGQGASEEGVGPETHCVRYNFLSYLSKFLSPPAGPDCLPDNDKMDRPVAPVTSYFGYFRAPAEPPPPPRLHSW